MTRASMLMSIALFTTMVCSCASAPEQTEATAAVVDSDWRGPKESDQGVYRISASADVDPIEINTIHSWTLTIETADGRPVEDAEIVIDGGMPQHQHGLPTAPEATQNLGGGKYLVDGMKFNMTGHWELKLFITAGGITDRAVLNLVLE